MQLFLTQACIHYKCIHWKYIYTMKLYIYPVLYIHIYYEKEYNHLFGNRNLD